MAQGRFGLGKLQLGGMHAGSIGNSTPARCDYFRTFALRKGVWRGARPPRCPRIDAVLQGNGVVERLPQCGQGTK